MRLSGTIGFFITGLLLAVTDVHAYMIWIPAPQPPPVIAQSTPERREADILKNVEIEPTAEPYLTRLTKKLFAANSELSSLPLHIHAVRSNHPVVHYVGNGIIFVSIGLLARLQNDSQVAAALATEIAAYEKFDVGNITQQNGRKTRVTRMPEDEFDRRISVIALNWMLQAGFDPKQAPVAMRRLLDTLQEDQLHSDTAGFSNVTRLQAWGKAFDDALSETASSEPAAEPQTTTSQTKSEMPLLARVYALYFARLAVNNGNRSVEFNSWVDRLDRDFGVSTETVCLRATFMQTNSAVGDNKEAVIDAFKKCASRPDTPAVTFRELGFLYQERHANQDALNAFSEYLKRAPDAVDKPIVAGYMENLRANP